MKKVQRCLTQSRESSRKCWNVWRGAFGNSRKKACGYSRLYRTDLRCAMTSASLRARPGRRLSACLCHWAVGLGAAWCGREVPGSILQTCLPTTVGYTLVCEVIIRGPGQEVEWDCQTWNKCLWVQVTGQLWEPTCQAGPEAEVWLQ